MSPAVIAALITVLKTVGASIGSLLLALLTGKTFKELLVRPIAWISRKTETRVDDKLVEDIREDWGLPPEAPTVEPNKEGDA